VISVGQLQVERFDNHHKRQGFYCGVEALDRYFYEFANQDRRRKVAVPYVLIDAVTGVVIGYYTLSSASVELTGLPPDLARRLPRHKLLPAVLIGRLAVHQRYHGQGIGGYLLMDALRRCLELSEQLAILAVIVDAIDEKAIKFYRAFGFEAFASERGRLFLPVANITCL
jgi:GNAT superfamily N-acetyltransferase